MTLLAKDTFVEASTIDLTGHTADVGGGWTAAAGTIEVIAGAGVIEDANSGTGNRYHLTTGVSTGPIEVSADITSVVGALVFPGIAARRPTASATAGGYEFSYLSGAWHLTDSSTSVNATEAWDGSLRTFKLHVEDNLAIGYINGVEKVRLTTNAAAGQQFAGVVMGNFSGTPFQTQISNFEIDSVASLLNTQSGKPVTIPRRVSRMRGPGGLQRGQVWAQATSAPAAIIPPPPPVITINSPWRAQMMIPMRPSAGGLTGGTPFAQATSAPQPLTPPNPPAGTGIIQMQTLQRIGNG